ncbi:TRAP transporter substrate-binding protein DctP [Saccharospirillum salsuginis]|uniref:Lactate-binding periplasmic protein n=1 Tax=Saccharospirillum salsuginis TaxID=418750 RepID=A0A918N7S4_9GAMM|nr:TRAP transporter substrate-binding protein DctP [Saccharospirillum salsuginis]GGX45177.1 lactate-binding periplasmic protein [Saccharospirillum salsuginis]
MIKQTLAKLALALSATVATTAVLADEIRMNVVSFTPKTAAVSDGFHRFIEAMNKEFEGELELNWRGGPEVMDPFRMADAVRNGAMDMALMSPSYYSGLVPSSPSSNISLKSYEEIYATGYYDRMTEIHDERGLVYLGEIPASDVNFFIFLKEPVDNYTDLEGKRIRVWPAVLPFVKGLGAQPLVLPIGEIYTAMERGVIDGFVQGNLGWAEQFEDVVNYYITPPIYRAGFNVIVNPRKWSRLPDDLQQRVQAYLREELAPELDKGWDPVIEAGNQEVANAGFQEIRLSDADAEAYLDIAIEQAWADLETKIDPALAAELKAMLVD